MAGQNSARPPLTNSPQTRNFEWYNYAAVTPGGNEQPRKAGCDACLGGVVRLPIHRSRPDSICNKHSSGDFSNLHGQRLSRSTCLSVDLCTMTARS